MYEFVSCTIFGTVDDFVEDDNGGLHVLELVDIAIEAVSRVGGDAIGKHVGD